LKKVLVEEGKFNSIIAIISILYCDNEEVPIMAVAKIILSALDQPHQDKDSSQYTLNF
jgi:hypothetical protein